MPSDTARYGLYFVPSSNSSLWEKGCAWLGRDAETGQILPQPTSKNLNGLNMAAGTAAPRRYGFHATLKPPFHLAKGRSVKDLRQTAEAFCSIRRPFETSPLEVQSLGNFVVLRPRVPSAAVNTLAADCVRGFDHFRLPPETGELQKRRDKGLSERQESLLNEWGYPYVLEEFRFHLTLTGSLPENDRAIYQQTLQHHFAADCQTNLRVDGLALFKQPERDAPFLIDQHYPFLGDTLN